jgi:hypothetical protein
MSPTERKTPPTSDKPGSKRFSSENPDFFSKTGLAADGPVLGGFVVYSNETHADYEMPRAPRRNPTDC